MRRKYGGQANAAALELCETIQRKFKQVAAPAAGTEKSELCRGS